MNSITILGRLASDPQLNDKGTLCKFSVAVSRDYKGTDGVDTDFFNIRVLGDKKAGFAAKYFEKGKPIAIGGRMQCDKYEKDGAQQYIWYCVADTLEFVPREKGETAQGSINVTGADKITSALKEAGFGNLEDDEMPF